MIRVPEMSHSADRRSRRCAAAWGVGALLLVAAAVRGQEVAIPTVGDSPTALQLCRRAEDLRDANPAEAARIMQRVMSEYGDRLVPVDEQGDRFVIATQRALALLRSSPAVRAEWEKSVVPTIDRLTEAGDDESLARTVPLSIEGMQAALRLAQRELEAGRAAGAMAWLDRIESEELARKGTPRDRAFALAMSARALALLGAGERAAERVHELEMLAATESSLAPILAAARGDASSPLVPNRDGAPVSADGTWHRIWRTPLASSPFVRRYLNPLTGPLLNVPTAAQAAEDGTLMTVLPLAAGERVYFCEGHVVTAIDRLSRRVRWKRSLAAGDDVDLVPIGDLSELALADGTLFVLTGHGSTTRRTNGGRLVALDAESGAVRWEQWLSRLEPADPDGGEGLFPHGAPLIVDGTVIVMARKMTARLESVATLVGFDASDGSLRWMTYIVGCGSRPMSGLRPFSNPVLADGAIFVASALGAVARVDPATGVVRWLTRFPVPVAEMARESPPWLTGGPAVIGAGVLTIAPDGMSVVLLDRETGIVQRAFPAGAGEAWGTPRALRASRDGRWVLAIGDDVALFDAAMIDRPRWVLSKRLAESGVDASNTLIRGRVDFAEEPIDGVTVVSIPLGDRLLLVDAEQGTVLRAIETGRPGNAVVAGGQALLAGNDRLECYMPLASAERAVRNWMARDERDPTRALALLELGVQCGVPSMIFEGVETAVRAVDQGGDEALRAELVARIVACITEVELQDADMRRLIAVAHQAARSPADQVGCGLAEGWWELRRGRPSDAVAAWQRVLSDRAQREVLLDEPDARRSAASVAMSRLVALVQSNGPSALAVRERAAEAAMRALGPAPTPEELLEVARAFSGSAAGAAAAQRVADALSSAGRSRTALTVLAESLRDRSRLAGLDASSRGLVNALLALARAETWNDAVAAELAALFDRTGASGASAQDLQFVRDALRTVAPHHPIIRVWPEVGAEAKSGATIPGVLALMSGAAEAERPTDRALFVERAERPDAGPVLVMRQLPDLEAVWSRPIEADDPIVLAFGPTIVLWQRGPGIEPSVLAVDASSGATRWSIAAASELFDRARLAAVPALSRRGVRDSRYLSPGEIIPLRADPWLVLARRNGDVAAVDLRDGSLAWRRDGVVDEIAGDAGMGQSLVAAGNSVIAVAGVRRLSDGSFASTLAMLDPARGEVIESVDLPAEVDWVSLAAGPLVLAAARNELHAFVPGEGRLAWSRVDHRIGNGEPSIEAGDRKLVVVTRGARRDELVAFSVIDGAVDPGAFVTPPRRSVLRSSLRSLQRVGASIAALYPDRLVLFDPSGRAVGQDAIAVDRSFAALLPTADTFVVVDPEPSFAFQPNPDRAAAATSGAVLYQLSRRDGARLVVDPIVVPMGDRPSRWCVLDGVIVGSGPDRSARLLLPAGSAR